jgi:hypothetical protein
MNQPRVDVASEVQLLNIPALCGRSWKTPNPDGASPAHRAQDPENWRGIDRAWDFNE